MESRNEDYISSGIEKVLLELDRNRILNEEDRLELNDYFLTEVENLEEAGLNEQEALLVAKKRFGVVDEIHDEYVKVKPGFDLLRYGIIGVVAFCMIKIFVILINLFSQIFWMVYYQFDPRFVREHVILDVPFRLVLILILGYVGGKLVSRMNFKNLSSLWKFPIFYIVAEVLSRLYFFILHFHLFSSDLQMTMEFFSNSTIVNYTLLAFVMVFASYKMYKMRIWEMEYV